MVLIFAYQEKLHDATFFDLWLSKADSDKAPFFERFGKIDLPLLVQTEDPVRQSNCEKLPSRIVGRRSLDFAVVYHCGGSNSIDVYKDNSQSNRVPEKIGGGDDRFAHEAEICCLCEAA